jgi:hypothetical protein
MSGDSTVAKRSNACILAVVGAEVLKVKSAFAQNQLQISESDMTLLWRGDEVP